jgi:hypothetical protein
MGSSLQINTQEFGRELERYLSVSNKDVEEVLNTKAFFITLGALGNTPRTEGSRIDEDLDKPVIGTRSVRKGNRRPRGIAPRAALIVNKRAGKHGRGLYGVAMALAIAKLRGTRKQSISYLKSTWLPPLREFGKKVPAAQVYRGGKFADKQGDVQVLGSDKGHGTPADSKQQGWNLEARLEMSLDIRGRSVARVSSTMSVAFQASIDKETESMVRYFDKKMQERADQFNSR